MGIRMGTWGQVWDRGTGTGMGTRTRTGTGLGLQARDRAGEQAGDQGRLHTGRAPDAAGASVGDALGTARGGDRCQAGSDRCPHVSPRPGPTRGAPLELLGGPELADLVASLPGFLLAVTREGKLVGVTDNVAQHLGHSMVSWAAGRGPGGPGGLGWVLVAHPGLCRLPQVDLVAQGDSIYDLLDPADHPLVRHQLSLPGPPQAGGWGSGGRGGGERDGRMGEGWGDGRREGWTAGQSDQHPPLPPERLFRCRFTTSRASRRPSAGRKLVLLRGRFQDPPGPPGAGPGLFVAFCAPLDPPPWPCPDCLLLPAFQSRHARDLALLDISDR